MEKGLRLELLDKHLEGLLDFSLDTTPNCKLSFNHHHKASFGIPHILFREKYLFVVLCSDWYWVSGFVLSASVHKANAFTVSYDSQAEDTRVEGRKLIVGGKAVSQGEQRIRYLVFLTHNKAVQLPTPLRKADRLHNEHALVHSDRQSRTTTTGGRATTTCTAILAPLSVGV